MNAVCDWTNENKLRVDKLLRRLTDRCAELRREGLDVGPKTGLVLDPYFSATKLEWILRNVRPRGDLAFGTVDSWLLWNLT
ncbi:MAG: hypothetical protein HC783_11020, partial [Rhodobacteraceae bacterium]|nr:hypothetical protein [Paracoccaceae bacterium]